MKTERPSLEKLVRLEPATLEQHEVLLYVGDTVVGKFLGMHGMAKAHLALLRRALRPYFESEEKGNEE